MFSRSHRVCEIVWFGNATVTLHMHIQNQVEDKPALHTYTHAHTHIRTYAHAHMRTRTYAHEHIRTYAHTRVHTHTHTHTYTHIHTHTHTGRPPDFAISRFRQQREAAKRSSQCSCDERARVGNTRFGSSLG